MASLMNNRSDDDAALVSRMQEGDVNAFEGLVLKYQNRIYNLCYRMVGDVETARDLAQETFLKAYKAMNRFHRDCRFYTWLYRIAVNQCISHHRKDRGVKLQSFDAGGGGDDYSQGGGQALKLHALVQDRSPSGPAEEVTRQEMRRAVSEALQTLDEDFRTILVLRDIESLDYESIAEVLEVPLGTVRSRLHRARMAMRELLKPVLEKAG